MAYAHAGWASMPTTAGKISELELHIAEVVEQTAGRPDVSADGKSVGYGSATTYLAELRNWLNFYERKADAPGRSNGGRSYARFNRPGP